MTGPPDDNTIARHSDDGQTAGPGVPTAPVRSCPGQYQACRPIFAAGDQARAVEQAADELRVLLVARAPTLPLPEIAAVLDPLAQVLDAIWDSLGHLRSRGEVAYLAQARCGVEGPDKDRVRALENAELNLSYGRDTLMAARYLIAAARNEFTTAATSAPDRALPQPAPVWHRTLTGRLARLLRSRAPDWAGTGNTVA